MPDKKIRIGTRGSQLALVQANTIKAKLEEAHAGLDVEIEVISTRGDRSQAGNVPLSEIGGKGLFTAEIESKLLSGEIDIAVHSTKDMPTALPEGLGLVCYIERENVADAFLSKDGGTFDALADGAVIGSASLRRRALLWRKRPDLKMVMFRGNVDTRLRKVRSGEVDATLLACAGLNRMGHSDQIAEILPAEDFLPAPGQGAVSIECRLDRDDVRDMLEPLNHEETMISVSCERAFLEKLDGSCRTPIGALGLIDGEKILLRGIILKPDGSEFYEGELQGSVSDHREIGLALGDKLIAEAGDAFFDGWA